MHEANQDYSFTLREAAAIVRCSVPALRRHIAAGGLKPHRLGHRVMISESEMVTAFPGEMALFNAEKNCAADGLIDILGSENLPFGVRAQALSALLSVNSKPVGGGGQDMTRKERVAAITQLRMAAAAYAAELSAPDAAKSVFDD